MIAKLSGRLDATGEDWAVVDVGGVGYLVHCSSRTLAALGEVGEACTVHTELQVSENDMRLLGAASALENLGFKPAVAAQAVARALEELGEGASEGDLIRVALKKAAG